MNKIPDHVLRSLKQDAIDDQRLEEDERHAAFLAQCPTPAHLLIDIDEVAQRLHDVDQEMRANRWGMDKYRSQADALSRRNAELRIELNELQDAKRRIERTQT